MSPVGSLILATYEMPRHLALVLAALKRQSTRDYELLICDDGSGTETRELIERYSAESPVPVRHFWQEHAGFRKCRILNRAVRESEGRTLIFLDGDCVPHRDFVRDHLDQQEPGRYLAGRRVELGPEISQWLTPEQVSAGFFDRPRLRMAWSCLRGDSEHFQRTIRFPWAGVRARLGMERIDDLKGCNYSLRRQDLVAINGFDESYEGYGREDTDVELRLKNLGLEIKSLKGLALQYHVWHPRRVFTPANDDRLNEVVRSRRVRCEQGLDQT